MNTVEFLDLILAEEGLICLAIPVPSGGFRHLWHRTSESAADAISKLDARGVTVYHACATFKTKDDRKHANVAKLGSFWLDVDVGEDKPYEFFKEAVKAVLSFAWDVGLPQPYIVKSGRGAHVYWPLEADLDPALWRTSAALLKAACKAWGLKADPSRTSDMSSVLRPVGSTHRKAEPRPVELKVLGKRVGYAAFTEALQDYLEANGGAPAEGDTLTLSGQRPSAFGGALTNADLGGGLAYSEKWADKAADQCAVLDLVRQTRGNVDQPTWYHALGVLAFCEDGDTKAHAWSDGHPDYTPEETSAKLAQIRANQTGPTTCAKLSDHQGELCAACPHFGKIKSPGVLGTSDAKALPIMSPPADPALMKKPAVRAETPEGFRFAKDPGTKKTTLQAITSWVPAEEGGEATVPVWTTICHTPFYPVSRLLVDGDAVVEFERIEPRSGEPRRFTITGAAIGKGKDACASVLGMNEIVTDGPHGPGKMDSLLKRWMTQLTETSNQIQSHSAFGWVDGKREFVLGDRVLVPGGGEARAILNGPAKQQAHAFVPAGSLQTWVETIDRAYNAPGQEAYQFLVMLGFAAPLMHMNAEINGVTVYAHSEGSGVGKTTATRAALSAWGHWDTLQMAEGKATEGSLWALMGCYKSVPVVFDELTNMDPRMASQLVFSVSSGRAKQRLKSDGDLRQNNANWRTLLLASGNNLLSEKLTQHRANSEAEMSRLFEFTVRATPHLTPNEAMNLFPKLLTNYGHAGATFIQYVLNNYDEVAARVQRVREALNVEAKITQKERFWSAMLATTLVATGICRKLGLAAFDVAALKLWMLQRLRDNRTVRVDAATDPLDLLGKMLADLWQGVLVTNGEGDLRNGRPARIINPPKGVMVGRAIMPDGTNQQTTLHLNEAAITNWAIKKGISAREIFTAAVAAGWADKDRARYALGRGTIEYAATTSYVQCWKLYPEKMDAASGGVLVAQKLNVIQGGASAGATKP